MKSITFLSILLAITVLFTNCEEEDTVKVDFEIIVTGESPNAIVQLTNTSDEADSFTWEFSEGADVETSDEVNPQITVDKTGEFTITLTSTTGSNENTKTKKVNITGVNGISFFENIELGKYNYITTIGNYFSCETGLAYTKSELTYPAVSFIDFALFANIAVIIYSPESYIDPIVGERNTDFNNNIDNSFTIEDFDEIHNENDLFYFSVAEDYHCYLEYIDLPKVIFINDYEGKWGAIKIKEHLIDKVIFDVKMQKYISE